MKKILVCSSSFGYGDRKKNLHRLFALHEMNAEFIPLEEARYAINDYEGLIIGTDKVTEDLFQRATRLKAVIKYGAGTDNIDKKSACSHGVQVLSLPGINRDAVAEMAIGLMLAASRRIVEGDRAIRSEKWERSLGSSIVGKTLGLVGSGAIGLTVAKMVFVPISQITVAPPCLSLGYCYSGGIFREHSTWGILPRFFLFTLIGLTFLELTG